MKLGIMQPYFFPYLGYFNLIDRVDRWIVFDTCQYIRHGWVNRNRILHPTKGWQYIVVPLTKHERTDSIDSMTVHADFKWKTRILGQLQHYRKRAPCYNATVDFVRDCLDSDETRLAHFNVSILEKGCQRLGIPFQYDVFSEMSLEIGDVLHPGEWALRICEAMGADEYVNPPGGVELFDPDQFAESGIKLTIQEFENMKYTCGGYTFEPGLSIIDVLMWNQPEQIREFFRDLTGNEDG